MYNESFFDYEMEALESYRFENIEEYDISNEGYADTFTKNMYAQSGKEIAKILTKPTVDYIDNVYNKRRNDFLEDNAADIKAAKKLLEVLVAKAVKSAEVREVVKKVANSFKVNPTDIKFNVRKGGGDRIIIKINFPDKKMAGYWGFMKENPKMIFKAILKYIDTEWANKFNGHSSIKPTTEYSDDAAGKAKYCKIWVNY